MIIKTIEELRNLITQKNFLLEKHITEKVGCEWDYNAKSFNDLNVDELDLIEIIMDFEKEMDCFITEELEDEISRMNPNELTQSYVRNIKLKELGI